MQCMDTPVLRSVPSAPATALRRYGSARKPALDNLPFKEGDLGFPSWVLRGQDRGQLSAQRLRLAASV